MKTLSEILQRDCDTIKLKAARLPLPGLVDWFLAEYADELFVSDSTMDRVGPALSKFYI